MSTKTWTGDYTNYSICPKCGKPYFTGWPYYGEPCQCYTTYVYTGSTTSEPKQESLKDVLEAIGGFGHEIILKFDPKREMHYWTIIMDGSRITDTDNPVRVLRKILKGMREQRNGSKSNG
jgi:hypothetical protein